MKRSEPRIFHYTIAELYNLIQQDQLIKPATEHVRLEAIPPVAKRCMGQEGADPDSVAQGSGFSAPLPNALHGPPPESLRRRARPRVFRRQQHCL
jgi:hypothetical protein